MSGKVHKRVVRNNMEVITENYEGEVNSWKRKTSKKEMKKEEVLASYQSYKDGDISMQALEETKVVTHRQHHNGARHQYDDADESDDYSSSRSFKRSSSSSSSSSDDVALSDDDDDDDDDNDDDNSLDESTASLASQTSSIEIKFEKEVDLYADKGGKALDGNTNDTDVHGEYYYGEIENGLLNGPMSPVSKYGQNEMMFNSYNDKPLSPVTDNRISIMEVKQAVIETSTMDDVVQSETNNNNHEQQVLSHISDNKVSKTEVKREVTIETYTVVGVSKINSKQEEQPLSPESDNRVSMLEVKQAVIEASTMGGAGETMSCEITDQGPEIKKAMMLETDIDSVAEIDANDSGDYKVVGANTEVTVKSGKSAGFSSTADVETSNKTKPSLTDADEYVNEKGNKSADTKAILGKKYVNNKVDAEVEKENKKNTAIIEARYAKETNVTQGKGHTRSTNVETVPGTNGTQKIQAESNKNMSGLRMDQYKITEKNESVTTTTTNKTEKLTVVQGSSKIEGTTGKSADEIDVTLRESRGRDRSKVKRELKLDIPNNNNDNINNNKSALLDQVLLSSDMSQGIGTCCRCGEGFGTHQQIVNSNGEVWHPQCFVCAQCFQPFPDGVFYEYEGRKYCERDFHVLFAPCCAKCGEFIIGRVIKAMNKAWHPDCFRCELCNGPLADAGFVKNAGRALCRDCNAKEKARGLGKYVCHKCRSIIEEGHIKYKGEAYHPYHFNCKNCGIELNADAREVNGELYCLRCHDKMGIPICGACRRPIEERVVHALGKAWHVEHFVCAKCEKPFFGTRHYEKKGLAYCEVHYHQLFGNICFVCNTVISGDVFHAFNKAWHVKCFACSICDRKMSQKTKFFEFDLKPVCKFCYEKFPGELKKRLKKAYEEQGTKK